MKVGKYGAKDNLFQLSEMTLVGGRQIHLKFGGGNTFIFILNPIHLIVIPNR